MSILIQKAHGVGGATFSNPTTPGSTVLVIAGAPNTSANAIVVGTSIPGPTAGDDKGNFYNDTGGTNGDATITGGGGGDILTDVWFIQTRTGGSTVMPPTPAITQVFLADSSQYCWIYELNCDPVTNSTYQGNATDRMGASSSNSPVTDLPTFDQGAVGQTWAGIVTPDVTGDFIAVIIGTEDGITVTAPAGWTADGTQGDAHGLFHAFYREAPNGEEADYHFTASSATAYALSMGSMASSHFGVAATGNIIVSKVTNPSGASRAFNFTSNYGPPFTLRDGESNDSGPLAAGTYAVSEVAATGWTTSTSSDPSVIVLGAGDTVRITFTNTGVGVVGGGEGSPSFGGNTMPWLVSIEDLQLTVNDLDGGADLADLIFNVQDRFRAITADFPNFIFEGKRMRLLAGYHGMARADFVTLFTGRIDSVESSNENNEYCFTCSDNSVALNRLIFATADDGFATDSNHKRTLNGHPLDILLDILQGELGMSGDIDVAKITAYRDQVYSGVQMEFALDSPPIAKDFIENELLKPLAAYRYTNNLGQFTVNFAYPLSIATVFSFNPGNLLEIPEAGQTDLVNQVSTRFDSDGSNFSSESVEQDNASVAKYGLYGQLIIEAKGLRSGLNGFFLAAITAFLTFLRYAGKALCHGDNGKNSASNPINAIWSAALLDPGDLVLMTHPLVPDRAAGVLGITDKTYILMDRNWQFFAGNVQYKMIEVDLSKFKQYLITPNGEADYTAASSADKAKYLFMCGDDDKYSNGDPANTLC